MYGVGDSGEGIGDAGDWNLLESGGVTFGGESEIFVSGGFDGGVGGGVEVDVGVGRFGCGQKLQMLTRLRSTQTPRFAGGSGAGSASAAAF